MGPNDVQPRGMAPAAGATAASVSPQPGAQPSSPSAAPAAAPAQPSAQGGIPEEVLQIPALTAVIAGQPGAVSANIDRLAKRPEGQIIAQNGPILQQAGIGFYPALDKKTGVMYNVMHISPEELQMADKEGKLLSIAPPFDEVSKAVQSGDMEGLLKKGVSGLTGQAKQAPKPKPNQSASSAAMRMKIPSSGTSAGKQAARSANLSAGSPSSGPKPGAGRILNSILKPVV